MSSLTQKSSPGRQEYSGPSIEATRRAFAAEVTLGAIERYEDSLARYASALARNGSDPALDKFIHVACGSFEESARNLANAILAWREASYAARPSKALQDPRGVVHGGKLYLAVADMPGRLNLFEDPMRYGGARDDDDQDMMHVAVVDLAEIVELDALLPASGGGANE